jgi:mannose PTS system EIIA component
MIGVILITHRDFGKSLLESSKGIVGEQEFSICISLYPGQGLETIKKEIEKVILQWKDLDGILILVDLFGGTPCNASIKFLNNEKVEIVSGINMSMLLTAFTQRKDKDIKTLADNITNAAKNNIIRIRSIKKS